MHLPRPITLAVSAGCAAALALAYTTGPAAGSDTAADRAPPAAANAAAHHASLAAARAGDEIAALRARGPAGLASALARWDAAPAGPERDRLAVAVDAVAGQRYATVSRLYWYTDLDAARAAASAERRPILALRMLGRLDEDLSCANSRLFRATLYADAEVARFLRDHFVLYWSSERPVPKVTIELGDGRRLEHTVTGNSAHYVLGDDGLVIDALPGLYAPVAFVAELRRSVALADRLRELGARARDAAVAEFHRDARARVEAAYQTIGGMRFVLGGRRLSARGDAGSELEAAQRATVSKYLVEVPLLGRIDHDVGDIDRDDVAQWAAIGQRLWRIGEATAAAPRAHPAGPARPPRVRSAPPRVLDDASRALVARLHNAGPTALAASPTQLAQVIARLEHAVVADSALDELRLRPLIRARLSSGGARDLAAVNAWVYANVFRTPSSDPWLGLVPRTDFTGLPGDGVVMP